jgi:hypothetical protein
MHYNRQITVGEFHLCEKQRAQDKRVAKTNVFHGRAGEVLVKAGGGGVSD